MKDYLKRCFECGKGGRVLEHFKDDKNGIAASLCLYAFKEVLILGILPYLLFTQRIYLKN